MSDTNSVKVRKNDIFTTQESFPTVESMMYLK